MSQNQPKVSVIIPVYNVENYLRECLDSVVNQTLEDIEIICVDDGSTDTSLKILREYEEKDARVKVFTQQNLFAGMARNKGLDSAKGEYCVFWDSDDFFELNALELLYKQAKKYNADICLCDGDIFDTNTGTYKPRHYLNTELFDRPVISKDSHIKHFFKITNMAPWNKAFRTEFVRANHLHFQALPRANDVYFVLSCLGLAERITYVKQALIHYRTGNGNSLQSNNAKTPLTFLDALSAAKARFIEGGVYDALYNPFRDIALSLCNYNLTKLRLYPEAFEILKQELLTSKLQEYHVNTLRERDCRNKGDYISLCSLLNGSDMICDMFDAYMRSNTDAPVVSLIIPVYNVEAYLGECLESLCNQTFRNIEIICVDDKSTDNSAAVLAGWADKDPRIRIITHSENTHQGGARNSGLEIARGKYVWFIDADDVIDTDAVEFFVKQMESLSDVDLITFNADAFQEINGKKHQTSMGVITRKWPKNQKLYLPRDAKIVPASIEGVSTTFFSKRNFIDSYRFRPHIFFEDACFAFSVLTSPGVFYELEYSPYHRRIREGSATSQGKGLSEKCLMDRIIALQDISAVINERKLPLDHFSVRWFENWAKYSIKQYWARDLHDPQTDARIHHLQMEWNLFDNDMPLELLKYYKQEPLIVSLTSYPLRIQTVHLVIETLLKQSLQPDKLILWLSEEEFPNREKDLPKKLLQQTMRGLEIEWCEDIKSYKKLIPALKAYPDAVIVTADDDIYYHQEWLERLYRAYINNPDCIHAHRITKFYLDENDEFAIVAGGQDYWKLPSYLNKLVGVGGVLYPPHCFHPDVLDESKFMELAPTSDDIWFWLMAALAGYKVTAVQNPLNTLHYVEGTQDCGLWHVNDHGEKLFWVHFNNILQAYPQLEQRLRNAQREAVSVNTIPTHSEKNVQVLQNKLRQKEQELQDIRSSISFKTGQTLTFVPRKLRGGIQCYRDHGADYTLRRSLYHMGLWEDEEAPKGAGNRPKLYKVPDKLRGGIQCYRDHGAGYTFRRTLYHMGLWEDEENPDYNKRPLLKRFSDCCSEHSAPYTAWRVLVKLHMAKDGEEPALIQRLETESPVKKKPAKAAGPVKKDYAYYSSLPPEKYPEELKLWYKRVMKEKLDLDNPKTYNEKIQWLKLYDSTPLKTRLADKYLVRAWVKQKIGGEYLISLLGVWDSFDGIDFDKLPNQFVLKANHGCGWNIIVKDKSTFDKEEARKKFDVWMHTNFAFKWGLELHYMNIPPKIIAEEYLENNDDDLYDYKVFCFDGKAESVMFLSDRKQELKMSFYDLQWNKLPFVYSYPQNPDEVPKPKNLELMINLAEKLAEGFPHVRVDFYVLNDGSIKFGEMTFTSAGGTCKWNISEQDKVYGDLIKLPPKSPIPMRLIYQDKRPEN